MRENEKAAPGAANTESGGEAGRWGATTDSHKQFTTEKGGGQGRIERLLPRGEENAVSAKELAALAGCRSTRQLQKLIEAERAAGALILSASSGGYFRPAPGLGGRREIAAYERTLRRRALSILRTLRAARAALKVLDGQTSIEG